MKKALLPTGTVPCLFSKGRLFIWIGAYDITAKTKSKTAQAEALILELLADGEKC